MKTIRMVVISVLMAVFGVAWIAAEGMFSDEPEEASEGVKLAKIVLYSSGLGYFERRGTVDGEEDLELTFKSHDINDLLKSLTLQDLDGGSISSVNYSSREPLASVLRSLTIDLSNNPGIAAILQQIRGRDVSVYPNGGGVPIRGTVVGLESKQNEEGRNAQFLNLRTRGGVRGIELSDIGSLDFSDPVLQEELGVALELLSHGDSGDEKRISIRFTGDGARRIRIGYMLAMPVWKTTYRLVLGEENEHYLQGWAIVENTTDEQWDGIKLSLVSGQPISFSMDLYRPIYISRPVVSPEVQAPVGPKVSEKAVPMAAPSARSSVMSAPSVMWDDAEQDYGASMAADYLGPQSGVDSAAVGAQTGEFFLYSIELPVTIPRKESAMVPIVTEALDGYRVSIYNASSHPIHPFNSIRITNSTGLDLKGGPVTVFESGTYAGDAVLRSLNDGSEAILSYSVDLATTVIPRSDRLLPEVTDVSISQGILTVERLYQNKAVYAVSSRGLRDRKIVVEHPIMRGWDLVSSKRPAEETASYYRFEIDFGADDFHEQELVVVEERSADEATSLERMSNTQIETFLTDVEVGRTIEGGLRGIVDRRVALQDLSRERNLRESRRQAIYRDQERIRKNMEPLAKDSDLYQRYEEQLKAQEDELDEIVLVVNRLIEQEKRLQIELADYIANLQG